VRERANSAAAEPLEANRAESSPANFGPLTPPPSPALDDGPRKRGKETGRARAALPTSSLVLLPEGGRRERGSQGESKSPRRFGASGVGEAPRSGNRASRGDLTATKLPSVPAPLPSRPYSFPTSRFTAHPHLFISLVRECARARDRDEIFNK